MAPRKRKGRDAAALAAEQMRAILAERTPEAVAFLVQIMRDEGQKAELRMKAAESILDRACGKASSTQSGEESAAAPITITFEGVLEEWSR